VTRNGYRRPPDLLRPPATRALDRCWRRSATTLRLLARNGLDDALRGKAAPVPTWCRKRLLKAHPALPPIFRGADARPRGAGRWLRRSWPAALPDLVRRYAGPGPAGWTSRALAGGRSRPSRTPWASCWAPGLLPRPAGRPAPRASVVPGRSPRRWSALTGRPRPAQHRRARLVRRAPAAWAHARLVAPALERGAEFRLRLDRGPTVMEVDATPTTNPAPGGIRTATWPPSRPARRPTSGTPRPHPSWPRPADCLASLDIRGPPSSPPRAARRGDDGPPRGSRLPHPPRGPAAAAWASSTGRAGFHELAWR